MKIFFWLIALLLFSVISLTGDVINERFQLVDLEVYYRTAERMLNGAAIYRIESDGHFVFKYAPSAAIYFMPFLLIGFKASKWIFWLIITAALAWGLHTLATLLKEKEPKSFISLALFCSVLAVVPHIHLEWHLGQVNLLLMVLFIAVIQAYQKGANKKAGMLLGASLFVKPFALIFLPYLFLKQNFTTIISLLMSVVLIGALPFIFYPSWFEFTNLYIGWITELQIELGNKQDLLAAGNHTIFSVLARYTPLKYGVSNPSSQRIYQVTVLAFMGMAFLWYMYKGREQKQSSIAEIALLIAWIPLLAFTSKNAFIYTLPLIVYLIFQYERLSFAVRITLVIGCFCIGINMYDIVGKTLHGTLVEYSIYTWGSILLSSVAFYLRWKRFDKVSDRTS